MNEHLQIIITIGLAASALFALIYGISVAISRFQEWKRKKEEEEEVVIVPVTEEVKRQEQPIEPPPRTFEEERALEQAPIASEPMNSRQKQQVSYECAGRARAAFDCGRLVEAYYFATVATLCGHRQLSGLKSQIRVIWKQVGFPSEKEMIGEDFSAMESAIGRAALRIDARHFANAGYACLTDLANGGNEIAADLLARLPKWENTQR